MPTVEACERKIEKLDTENRRLERELNAALYYLGLLAERLGGELFITDEMVNECRPKDMKVEICHQVDQGRIRIRGTNMS